MNCEHCGDNRVFESSKALKIHRSKCAPYKRHQEQLFGKMNDIEDQYFLFPKKRAIQCITENIFDSEDGYDEEDGESRIEDHFVNINEDIDESICNEDQANSDDNESILSEEEPNLSPIQQNFGAPLEDRLRGRLFNLHELPDSTDPRMRVVNAQTKFVERHYGTNAIYSKSFNEFKANVSFYDSS